MFMKVISDFHLAKYNNVFKGIKKKLMVTHSFFCNYYLRFCLFHMHQSTVVILFDIQRAHLSSMGVPSRCLRSPLNVIPLVFSGRIRYPRLLAWIWNQPFLQGILLPFYACKGHSPGTRGRFILQMVIFVLEWQPPSSWISHYSSTLWSSGST